MSQGGDDYHGAKLIAIPMSSSKQMSAARKLASIDVLPYNISNGKEPLFQGVRTMAIATLTSKGQTTIPREIRESLDLAAGDELHFTLLPNGTVVMRAKKRAAASLAGMLNTNPGKRISLRAMDDAIGAAAVERMRIHVQRTARAKRK